MSGLIALLALLVAVGGSPRSLAARECRVDRLRSPDTLLPGHDEGAPHKTPALDAAMPVHLAAVRSKEELVRPEALFASSMATPPQRPQTPAHDPNPPYE